MRIRTILQARASARSAGPPGEEPEAAYGSLTAYRSPDAKLTLAAQLVNGRAKLPFAQELLQRLHRREQGVLKTSQFKIRERFESNQLKQVIQNHTVPMSIRRQGIRALGRAHEQDALDYLSGMLLVESDVGLREEAAKALVRMRMATPELQFPISQIRRLVAPEVAGCQRITQVAQAYRQQHDGPVGASDPVIGLLRLLNEESTEQVFRMLMLLYRPGDIHLVYEQLRASDKHVRADAAELLDNLVDHGMRRMIFPILDEDRFLFYLDENEKIDPQQRVDGRVLQEAIWDSNCWLSITAICAVGRLRLTAMWPELEKASRHTEPLVSSAAKVALQFAGDS